MRRISAKSTSPLTHSTRIAATSAPGETEVCVIAGGITSVTGGDGVALGVTDGDAEAEAEGSALAEGAALAVAVGVGLAVGVELEVSVTVGDGLGVSTAGGVGAGVTDWGAPSAALAATTPASNTCATAVRTVPRLRIHTLTAPRPLPSGGCARRSRHDPRLADAQNPTPASGTRKGPQKPGGHRARGGT